MLHCLLHLTLRQAIQSTMHQINRHQPANIESKRHQKLAGMTEELDEGSI